VRPERLRPAPTGLSARVVATAFEGHLTHVSLVAADGRALTMSLGRDAAETDLTPEAPICIAFPAEEAVVLRQEAAR
jgi:hypothetical protein